MLFKCFQSVFFLCVCLFSVKGLLRDISSYHFYMTTQPDDDPITEIVRHDVRSLIISITVFPIWVSYCINCYVGYFSLFSWTFVDILLMIISISLTTHFKLINNELKQAILFAESHSHCQPLLEVSTIISR